MDAEGPQASRLIDTKLAPSLFALPSESSPQRRSLALRNLQAGVRLGLPSGQAVAEQMGQTPLSDEQLVECPPGQAPLWFYVLREASELGSGGKHLGPVGGRIVGETFLGLLRADPTSYYNAKDPWLPDPALRSNGDRRDFEMADLLRWAVPEQAKRF